MSISVKGAAVLMVGLVLAGCASEARLPQCRGAWLPVNAPESGEVPAERIAPEKESVDGTA